MTREKNTRELSPLELWDQLAVQQVKHQLAPHGFKKIHNGKHEVTTAQFLSKQTVNMVCVISANLIRLYRENLREILQNDLKDQEAKMQDVEDAIKRCRFWEWGAKKALTNSVCGLDGQIKSLKKAIQVIDNLKPSAVKK